MRASSAQQAPCGISRLIITACIITLVSAGAIGGLAETIDSEPITPVPPVTALDPAKIELGQRMFHDARLSGGNNVSCASCHDLARGGVDGRARSPATSGGLLDFNTLTVFNAALNAQLNWRGNFRTLKEQIGAVLLDPRLMNATWPELLAKLRADSEYRAAFKALYGGELEREHVLDALVTFQRSLLTPDARFDRYLRGEREAISADEARGYDLFKAYGCAACHQGANIGGNLFQRFGVFHDPFAERGTTGAADLGRYTVTAREEDRKVFRVPSLRNVAVTPPYLHDGSVASLDKAVGIMARSQLGRELPREDINLIVRFLHTLTGVYQGRSLAPRSDSESQ